MNEEDIQMLSDFPKVEKLKYSRTIRLPPVAQTVENLPSIREIQVRSLVGKIRFPQEGNGNPTPVFLPGESHGQRSLDDRP